jgi:NAD(P)-dependent dehydrogenase (short-subunit alcohol dehydrogenase family)
MSDRFSLAGRVAIVTGASSGLGAHFVATLAEAGASVVAAARRLDRLEALAEQVPGVVAVAADVSDDDDCRRVVATAIDTFGRVDVLVNNAGISDGPAVAADEDLALFRRVIDVNLTSCFVLAQACATHMSAQGSGAIVNIASVHGLVGSAPNNQAAYSASKAGLVNLTRELALQWARTGIRVNAIAPGYFATELTEEMIADEAGGLTWIKRNTPLRRPGEVAELDGALLLLASDAGSYITGHTLVVDGGWTAR